MTQPRALAALRRALTTGRVRFVGHALARASERGWELDDILSELDSAAREGDVSQSSNGPGRWLAYGVSMVVCFEVVAPDVVVVTVFHQGGVA